MKRLQLLLLIALVCSISRSSPERACKAKNTPFGWSEPEDQGINAQPLLELTDWIKSIPVPILSVVLSKNGRVVYELYTSNLKQEDAHYLMSVTKSVTSALVGVAIDRHYLKGVESKISDALPRSLFPDETSYQKFKKINLKEVMGMSALDAQVAPHLDTPEGKKRLIQFFNSPNRVRFALSQELLPKPGIDFQYTDVTPSLAAGLIQFNVHRTLFDFANEALFQPMGFENQEWMHEDPAGIDNGAYGLRLRPIDMQKFGILYLNRGCWGGRQLISSAWTDLSFSPWIKSQSALKQFDYGSYWWHYNWSHGWTAHIAAGWKGQRIAVFPEKNIVLTMTAIIEDKTENELFGKILSKYVVPAVEDAFPATANLKKVKAQLQASMKEVNRSVRIKAGVEERMIPSVSSKEKHIPFKDAN